MTKTLKDVQKLIKDEGIRMVDFGHCPLLYLSLQNKSVKQLYLVLYMIFSILSALSDLKFTCLNSVFAIPASN